MNQRRHQRPLRSISRKLCVPLGALVVACTTASPPSSASLGERLNSLIGEPLARTMLAQVPERYWQVKSQGNGSEEYEYHVGACSFVVIVTDGRVRSWHYASAPSTCEHLSSHQFGT